MRKWLRECGRAWATGSFLAMLTMFILAPAVVPMVLPISYFYELRSVTIDNTVVGVSPGVIVDRVIHRNFRGRFEIVIMRVDGSNFVPWWECGQHDSDWRPYRVDASLPTNLDLDWWMDIPPNRECPLPAGKWKILTTIYVQGPFNAILSETTESNLFEIFDVKGPEP